MQLSYRLEVIAVKYAVIYIENEMSGIRRYLALNKNDSDYRTAMEERLKSLKYEYKELKSWLESVGEWLWVTQILGVK